MWLLKIRRLVRHAGREALILFFAMRHPGTPMALKLASAAALAYVISPVDLVPDLPVIGWVDDAMVLGVGLPFLVRRLPPQVHEDATRTAEFWLARLGLWRFVDSPAPRPAREAGGAQEAGAGAGAVRARRPSTQASKEDVVDVVEVIDVSVTDEATAATSRARGASGRHASDTTQHEAPPREGAAAAPKPRARRPAKAPGSAAPRAPRRSRRAPAPAA